MTQYCGFDVLEIEPSREDVSFEHASRLAQLDSVTGKLRVIDRAGFVSMGQNPFRWVMNGRSEVDDFRAFRAARRGRLVPFWVPTWERDLVLAQNLVVGSTGIVIEKCSYTRFAFPTPARRHIALMNQATKVYRKVTDATEGSDDEVLTFDAAVGANFDAATTLACYLTLCRLSADFVSLAWQTTTVAIAELSFTELPLEVPA